ncbi:DUF6624 domain-containing protein [Hymenobacter sp. GOD-10R]|uniref:DUF6624 domain-containing protein n=1 Tax=Hymenobacter sp. GOD-10R TaxID=3093922 RepID=UPI002D79F564|nr:DUF6624 domain-containing protein [Hymenobacter sp. GOD-10R]WRQ31871.1 DUF6624 domain-containing protein [Hymenobacter sp. GOD-10R]
MRYSFLGGTLAWLLTSCQVAQPVTSVDYSRVKQELQHIYEQDQQIRESIMAVGMDSKEAVPLFKQMRGLDSVNQVYVRTLLTTSGWPARSQVGEQAATTIFLVVQHSNRALIRQYLPALRKRVRQGEASQTDAALMEDRLRMFSGKKQRFGTQTANWVRQDGTLVIWPIQQPARVNRYRQALGFPTTVEQNAAKLGAVYNPKERLPSPKVVMP